MKKILLGLYLSFLALALAGQSQGLEKIIVEKYYVSNAGDEAGSSGTLPAGSVTWRIYADMAPGYYLLQVYGIPTHPLTISTTTSFFNNTDYGAVTPAFSATNAKKNTVMLDSWLSTGNACTGYLGVLKSEDDGVGTFVNKNGLLQNADASAGIPLTTQDGLMAGTNYDISVVGINTDAISDGSVTGSTVSTTNGSWYSTTHPQGPTANNRVLIAQLTSNGPIHYEINIEIGKDLGGGQSTAEYYVFSNPQGEERYDPKYHLSGNLPPVPPTVSITSPAEGSSFHEGNVVSIAANAADADGSVSKVEFFVNGSKVGEDATAPYTYNWTSVGGNAVLTAVAIDNELNQTTSNPVNITVTGNVPPTVSITTPSTGAKAITGDLVSIAADATDADGTVAKVEFFVNGTKVGEDATSPYQYDWTSVKGTALITAQATDDKGAKSNVAQVSVSVADNKVPSVNITSAHNSQIILTTPYLITADAMDTDGTITKVEFFVDGTKVGEDASAPYQYSWANSVLGRHTFTAKATDDRGASTTSPSIVNVTVAPPTVAITSPTEGSSSKVGDVVAITATAADADGTVISVEFFVDGVSIGLENSAPYTVNYTGVAGSHTITAKATDNDAIPATSAPVAIMVNTPPTINITAPADNASSKVGEVVAITATANDADGTVASVEFFVDNVSIGTDNTAPYAINYTGVLGSHVLTAKATDNNGSQTASASVTINIVATGIGDINYSGSTLKIYPNPVTDAVTLEITASQPAKNVSYKIINIKGQVIVDKTIGTISDKYLESIHVSSLANGQYTIELFIDASTLSQKIIKQ
jgi:hypothetical protein